MSTTKLRRILGSPVLTSDNIALTPLSWNVTSSFSIKALLFLNITLTLVVPFLSRTKAAAPELLPMPISPMITSPLSPLGPVSYTHLTLPTTLSV